MQDFAGTVLGKAIRLGLFFRRGGGQALPGMWIEKLFPGYVPSMLKQLPGGSVIITGTNGKTTTTKIITELLEANGRRVLTNPTGSNLVRGIASALAHHAKITGKLAYDIAILEVDEATARKLAPQINPQWVLGLNVSRDQLDRFGEVDAVAAYVGDAMRAAAGIITNAGDPHLSSLAERIAKDNKIPVHYFGAAGNLSKFFPTDYDLAAVDKVSKTANKLKLDVELAEFTGQKVVFKINGHKFKTELKLTGQHNFLNAAAALALCRRLLPNVPTEKLVEGLSEVSLAFGRGEIYQLKTGAKIELVLVKNPASFTQALSSYSAKDTNLLIAINDNIADGRDVSWLWDVNFKPLSGQKVAITSGTRAADMGLRLSYDEINVANIEPSLPKAVRLLSEMNGPKVILATYTAMLQLYGYLTKHGEKTE